ncbi:MAG: type 2 lanthipeptide synthetase LanM [Thermoanaerobaculia bacterium]
MSSRADRLLAIVARAAPPHERAEATWLTPLEEQNEPRLQRMLGQWRKAVADKEPRLPPLRGVLAVRVTGDLPPWAAAFVELASEDDLFAAVRRVAESFDATPSARDDLLRMFDTRVNAIVSPLFEYERQLAASTAALGKMSPTDWPERFERFPVLAYLLGTAFEQWRTFAREMFARLAADLPELGRVSAFRGDAGDVHGGGRAVALLTFESGARIAYKPKDLRCAAALNDVIELLEPSLRTRRILVRDGYGWEEVIAHIPCANENELALFYRRFGMLVRLLQLVEARDFWLDNLIAEGAQPVFIDLETILQPRVPAERLSAAEIAARRRLGETVVESCTIAMATPIDVGVTAEDLGALAPPRDYLTPFRQGDRFITWRHDEHAPTLNGVAGDPSAHYDEIVDGYRHMNARIEAMRATLLAEGSPLLALRDAPVRFIRLDTWSYYKLLRRSYMPALLVDAVQREIALQQLLGQSAEGDAELELTRAEIAALRQMDVPLFLSIPANTDVITPQQTLVPDYFDGSAWSRLERRLTEPFPLEQEIDALQACFTTVYSSPARPSAPPSARPLAEWHDQAIGIADQILSDAIEREGELAFLGVAYHPHIDLLAVEVLHADLLTGTCGAGLLFAELHALTGERRFAEAARATLAATIRADRWPDVTMGKTPLYCGAVLGAGAHIFTLRTCAELLDDASLASVADAYAARLPMEIIVRRCTNDVIAGTSGLALALGGVIETDREPRYPQRRRRLDCMPGTAAARAIVRARLGLDFEPFPLDTPGNVRAALELGLAIDEARMLDDVHVALDVFELTGERSDHARAEQLVRNAPEPLRYDLSPLWGRVAQARAYLRLGGTRVANIATLRSDRRPDAATTSRERSRASHAPSGDCS